MNKEDLKSWISNNLNVAIIGYHGTGKSTKTISTLKEMGLTYKYLHCPTLDPMLDLLGLPKTLEDENGPYVDFIKPRSLDYGNVEVLIFDEPTRANKKIRDALLEIILMKSINGVPFPKLKSVIVAFNPADSEDVQYQVDELDPAFLDRFDVIYNMDYDVDVDYFREKYGKDLADPAIEFWREIPVELRKKHFSPRRLDFVLNAYRLGVDVVHCAPSCADVSKLLQRIDGGSIVEKIHRLIKKDNDNDSKKFISSSYNRDLVLVHMKNDNEIESYFLPFLSKEFFLSYCTERINDSPPVEIHSDDFGTKTVSSLSINICNNLKREKFRETILRLFYGKTNATLEKIKQETTSSLCILGTTFEDKSLDWLNTKPDLSKYIDQCMTVNTLWEFPKDSTGGKVKEILDKIKLSNLSRTSCLYKKYKLLRERFA